MGRVLRPRRADGAFNIQGIPSDEGDHWDMTMRLPYLSRDELSPQGQDVWELIHASRGARSVDSEGHLVGPFNAFVHCPSIGIHLGKLGAELRFGSSLDPRLLELAIITTGARWRAEFEWWAHAALARQQGIPDGVIEDIRSGRIPEFESD